MIGPAVGQTRLDDATLLRPSLDPRSPLPNLTSRFTIARRPDLIPLSSFHATGACPLGHARADERLDQPMAPVVPDYGATGSSPPPSRSGTEPEMGPSSSTTHLLGEEEGDDDGWPSPARSPSRAPSNATERRRRKEKRWRGSGRWRAYAYDQVVDCDGDVDTDVGVNMEDGIADAAGVEGDEVDAHEEDLDKFAPGPSLRVGRRRNRRRRPSVSPPPLTTPRGWARDVALPPEAGSEEEQEGVLAVEAAQSVWGSRTKMWGALYLGVGLVAYVTSLDGQTAYLYLNEATSEFGKLPLFSAVQIVQQMIIAVAKPPIAKLSDVFGRAEAYLLSVFFYVLGYFLVAVSSNLQQLSGGIVLYAIGSTGVQVLQQVIIADTTTAKWRGLVIGLVDLPYIINFGIASKVAGSVTEGKGWRWGYGMFCILVPIASAPLIATLAIGERRARRANLVPTHSPLESRGAKEVVHRLGVELDLVGLFLLSIGWLLLLLALTLAGGAPDKWRSPHIVLMIAGGALSLLSFGFWEVHATRPLLPYHYFKNRSVMSACMIGCFDFASFYLSWNYLSSFVQISRGWNTTVSGYFASTQNITMTVAGILVGGLMAWTRHYKYFIVFGTVVRMLGVALMIRFRAPSDSTFSLVLCQVLQGVGGGMVGITIQVAAQVCVRHGDVAVVTALILLLTEIGGAIGSAVAGALYTQLLPRKLEHYLPYLTPEERQSIYGGLQGVSKYPIGSAIRDDISQAWVDVMRTLCLVATLMLLPCFCFSWIVHDKRLTDLQNVVEDRTLEGEEPDDVARLSPEARHRRHHHHHQRAPRRASRTRLNGVVAHTSRDDHPV